jgi:hypothetical protein
MKGLISVLLTDSSKICQWMVSAVASKLIEVVTYCFSPGDTPSGDLQVINKPQGVILLMRQVKEVID